MASDGLMTAQAPEFPAVANDTAGLIEIQFAGSMVAEETRDVAGRLESGAFGMALLAAKGIIDFGMANQAICHLGHGGKGDLRRLRQAAMAGLAGVRCIQMAADVARRLKVGFLIDGGSQQRRDVAHLEVLGVAEEGDARRRRRRDPGILMALEADRFRGQQVVRCLGAGGGRGVAGGALEFQREVQLMRKRRAEGRTPRHTPRDQQDGEPFHPL